MLRAGRKGPAQQKRDQAPDKTPGLIISYWRKASTDGASHFKVEKEDFPIALAHDRGNTKIQITELPAKYLEMETINSDGNCFPE
jgi:hypothetical protein